ncbi:MAG: efflux RND transporter periplasmic adaptor subunit [Lautropia sp.]
MNRPLTWLVLIGIAAAVGFGGWRVVERRAAKTVPKVQAEAATTSVVELAPTDVATVRVVDLTERLAVSGTLRAIESAWLKARVAGELRQLRAREGDAVAAGEVVAQVDPTEYRLRRDQAQRLADAASAQIDIARRTYDNNLALVEKGFISRTALDASRATLEAARANYEAAVAAAEVAGKSMADTLIRSPIDGRIAQRVARNGERVGVDSRIVEVVDPSAMELETTVAGADSLRVRVGQRARVRVEGATADVDASVVRINPSANESTRSVPVYLRLASPAGLRQGLFASGGIEIAHATAPALPLDAVRTDRPRPYVQLIVEGRIEHRTVEPGRRGQVEGREMVEVPGLDVGARVLVGSVGRIPEGTAARETRIDRGAAS